MSQQQEQHPIVIMHDVFAKEQFYKDHSGKEEAWEGELATLRIEPPEVGVVMRTNYYTLLIEKGTPGTGEDKKHRQVHTQGSRHPVIENHVNSKKVRIVGKASDFELEGRHFSEILPASIGSFFLNKIALKLVIPSQYKMVAIKSLCVFLILFAMALVTVVDAFDSQLMLKLVNDERKKVGASPLTLDSKLTRAAQKHTDFMVSSDELTHDDPAGSLGERVKAEGYNFSSLGENIAKGFGTNEEVRVMKTWMNSSGHRANILNKSFTNLGVGFGGGKYWTQVFGKPLKNKRSRIGPARLVY